MVLQSVASGLHGYPGWGATAASLGREQTSIVRKESNFAKYAENQADFVFFVRDTRKANNVQAKRLTTTDPRNQGPSLHPYFHRFT
jgi:hypothetical protein